MLCILMVQEIGTEGLEGEYGHEMDTISFYEFRDYVQVYVETTNMQQVWTTGTLVLN